MAAWPLLTSLLVLLVDLLRVSAENGKCGQSLYIRLLLVVTVMCSGRFWCAARLPSDRVSTNAYFHYTPKSGVCEELDPASYSHCVPAANCTFSSARECYSVCGAEKKSMPACEHTTYGCCGDGVTIRQGETGCPGESSVPSLHSTKSLHNLQMKLLLVPVVVEGVHSGALSHLESVGLCCYWGWLLWLGSPPTPTAGGRGKGTDGKLMY